MQRPPRILVFDSGVGGLSILREIRKQLPWVETVYACDNAFFPYGTKEQHILEARVEQVVLAAARTSGADVTVVACNTASTAVLPRLRARLQEPVVGVVPAIKPAAELSQSRVIGLLATPGTIKRSYTHTLVKDFAGGCEVIMVGSSELVSLAEHKLRGGEVDDNALEAVLAPFAEHPLSREMDTLVLGCTHFPLLQSELQAVLPKRVRLVDSGHAIARRVASLLSHADTYPPPKRQHSLFTRLDTDTTALMPALESFGCGTPELLRLD